MSTTQQEANEFESLFNAREAETFHNSKETLAIDAGFVSRCELTAAGEFFPSV